MVFSRAAIVKTSSPRVLIAPPCASGASLGETSDRGDVGRYPEQARTSLVVQLVGDLPPLVLLHGDEVAIEPAVLGACLLQRLGQRVEPLRR